MKSDKKMIKDQKNKQAGQVMIEGILLLLIFVSAYLFIKKQSLDNNYLGKILARPWPSIAGMMSTGNWVPLDEAIQQEIHPHLTTGTREGDTN